MKTLAEIATEAFHQGSDKFGESVTGVQEELKYSETCKYYSKTVFLVQKDGHKCTSGIGFYPYIVKEADLFGPTVKKMDVCSGHIVFRGIEITPELQAELDKAYVSQY
jgi:hypothetical protein